MIRIDLTAADIDYEDNSGRFADFHALRHTFISNLARAGVHPRNAEALARHSTIDLRMNVYTHVAMGDLHDDVKSLAGLVATVSPRPGEPRSAPSRRTPRPPNSRTWSRRGAICPATSVLQDHCGVLIGATGFARSG